MEQKVILLMSLSAFAADHWDLLRTMQERQAVLSQPILLGTTNAETKNAAETIKRIDPNLRIISQPLPVIGDFDAEINRALAQNKLECAIILRIENDDWSLTDYGDCTSPDPTLSLNETEADWEVLRTDRQISAMEWAVLTQDSDLHELLLQEQRNQLTIQRSLLIGSGLIAVSSLAPLQGIQPGGGSATEDRLWTSAFLLSTAWMLYKASKYPALKTADTQEDLSNYISKPYAQTTINGLFSSSENKPNGEPESGPKSETDDAKASDAGQSDNASKQDTDSKANEPKETVSEDPQEPEETKDKSESAPKEPLSTEPQNFSAPAETETSP